MESSVLLSRFLVARKPVQLFRRETSFTTELALCNKSLSRKNVAHINWEMSGKIKYDRARNRKKKKLKLPPFWIFKHGTLWGVNSNKNTNKYILFAAKWNNITLNFPDPHSIGIIFPLPYSLSYLTLIRSCHKIRISKNLDQYNFRFFHSDWDPCTTI